MFWVVLIGAAPGFLFGVAMLWSVWRTVASLDALADTHIPDKDRWPVVSLISPACNEEAHLEASLKSVLSNHYPRLEVVAINDRSNDRTPQIIDTLAETDDRLKPVHITHLPDGWLGKLNAMAQGVEAASGEWLLFCDADVIFAPNALQKAIAYAESKQLDYLAALAKIEPTDFWADTVFNVLMPIMFVGARPWAVRNPESEAILGSGAFVLVRRSAYDASPGLEWMRLEVADDQTICALIKSHGGRCDVVNGCDDISLEWYHSLGEMVRMMQKNFFAIVAHFSLLRGLATALGTLYLGLFPLLVLVTGAGWASAVPALGLIAMIVATLWSSRWVARPWLPCLFPGIGLLLVAFMVTRASLIGWRAGGIFWRGVFYSSELLNAHQRYGRRRS